MAEPAPVQRATAPPATVHPTAVPSAARGKRARRQRWAPLAVGVLFAVLILTAALTAVALHLYRNNEQRLLNLRTRDLGLIFQEVVPDIQTPLASAAALADATQGSGARFATFAAGYAGPKKEFISMSLWAPGATRPTAVVGRQPILGTSARSARTFMARTSRAPTFSVVMLSSGSALRLGYGYHQSRDRGGYIAYGESVLAPSRHAAPAPANSPFSDLNYALYLGRAQAPANLLTTDLSKLPASGTKAVERVAFGDSVLTLVGTPRGSLGGSFFALLPWLIAGIGTILAFSAGLVTDRLGRRGRHAEVLATLLAQRALEVSELFDEQREIAQTLQRAILPDALPRLRGVETAALYQAGGTGVEVGGDWYDLIEIADGHLVAIVGDVSGHGLRAATTMATLRTAAFAYAARDSNPGSILERVSDLVARKPHNYFATVLCMRIAVDTRVITLASAGHLPPLLVSGGEASYVAIDEVGPPVGAGATHYGETKIDVAADATMIAFTDGLVERRGEIIDDGLERLRECALANRKQPLEDLLATINRELVPEHATDDTAILAVRWQH